MKKITYFIAGLFIAGGIPFFLNVLAQRADIEPSVQPVDIQKALEELPKTIYDKTNPVENQLILVNKNLGTIIDILLKK